MHRVDLTYPLNNAAFTLSESVASRHGHIPAADLFGHVGTHLDLMGKTYPDDYFTLTGRVFDVHAISGRDIEASDIDMNCINNKDFVFFHSGCLASLTYGSAEYMSASTQLSWELLHLLIDKQVSMIGIDFAGVRRHKEHREADMLCAEAGVFIVENVFALDVLVGSIGSGTFTVHCYPLRLTEATGLPCRVIAEF